MWDSLRQDVGFGIRMLRRQPGFTAVALIALALGIGANTAIFSVVDAVLWRPLPYPGADEIVSIGEQRPREGRLYGPVSPADFFDWRRDGRSFAAMAAYDETAMNLTGAGEPERLRGLSVSPAFLQVLGVATGAGPRHPRRGGNARTASRRAVDRRVLAAAIRRRFGRSSAGRSASTATPTK